MSRSQLHRVVVLGAGFGGMRVARQLARGAKSRKLSVTLVNRTGVHVYTPAFYALAGTTSDSARHRHLERAAALPLRRLCKGLPVSIVEANVTAIDAKLKRVALGDGRSLSYDTIVVALGSEPAYYDIPGLREHAITLKTLADADKISRRASALMRGRDKPLRIVVGGGGVTGCELSAMLAETVGTYQAGAHITLVEGSSEVLPGFDEATRSYVRRELNERQVMVRAGQPIKAADESSVTLQSKEAVPFDLLIWTGGIQVPEIIGTLPYVLERGRIATDAPLTCVPKAGGPADLHAYALGDATYFLYGGKAAPWTAQVALQQADTVARNILRVLDGKKPKPFKLPKQSILIPLGRTGGAGSLWGFPVRGWIVQPLVWVAEFRYLASMMPWWAALKLVSRRIK